jgi:hypothetical protein
MTGPRRNAGRLTLARGLFGNAASVQKDRSKLDGPFHHRYLVEGGFDQTPHGFGA